MATLFEAFHEDHAILGRGFYEISTLLRGGDLAAARDVAVRLDKEAGPHVAFEERHFYPALRKLIGDEGVDRFYHEHREGLDVIRFLLAHPEHVDLTEDARAKLIRQSDIMEEHIAECGGLFEAMGRIPQAEQDALLQDLLAWREKRPSWTSLAAQDDSPET